ncbi:hypothetical protein BAQ49_05430 [Bacillus proteolyticus]|uniref:Uncharacterized protein n=1 Tax=Bacillus proteolyticus TaxID=2026192 RepID=A0AA44KX27_9BACI|nr:hypothetical protein [Bacillus proteolyticus]OJE47666.1 hypothetical protein BAQ49_05430 [Bacillus proteolyticus]
MDAMLQNIKLKKKLEYLSNLAIENQELKESIKELSVTVEELKQALVNLQNDLRRKISEEDILEAIVCAIEEVKEID